MKQKHLILLHLLFSQVCLFVNTKVDLLQRENIICLDCLTHVLSHPHLFEPFSGSLYLINYGECLRQLLVWLFNILELVVMSMYIPI